MGKLGKFKLIISIVIIFLFSLIIYPNNVNAELVNDGVPVKLTVIWLDFDDHFKLRPDELNITLKDMLYEDEIKKTLNVENAEVKRVSETMTKWVFEFNIVPNNSNPSYYISNFSLPGYKQEINGMVREDGGNLELVLYKDLTKKINFTVNFDDGGERDAQKYCLLHLIGINKDVSYELEATNMKPGEDVYTQVELISAYNYDENGVPIWDDPVQYDYVIAYKEEDYTYDVDVDDDGNITVNVHHTPYTIDPVKVNVEWNDEDNKNEKRPEEIILEFLNQYNKVEKEVKINSEKEWKMLVSDLYKNVKIARPITYSVRVKDIPNYTFEVTGDQENGFNIKANYTSSIKIEEKEEDKNTINPDTSDNISFYIYVMIVSIIVISFVIKFKMDE